MNISESAVESLLTIQREMAVACWLDWRYDVNGNSYNAHEAEGGLKAAFIALGLEWSPYEPTKEELAQAIQAIGEDPDDYDLE